MTQAVKLKGGMVAATHLLIQDLDLERARAALDDFKANAPSLIKGMPIVLEFGDLTPDRSFIEALLAHIDTIEANAFAVRGQAELEALVEHTPLSYLGQTRTKETAVLAKEQVQENTPASTAAPMQVGYAPAMHIQGPIRSGQQVYANNSDLIIVGNVSSGAEVFAAGSIHIYGALRGRAVAGISGDPNARIYCQSMDAELLSLDGLYQFKDAIPDVMINTPVVVSTSDETLIFNAI